MKTGWCLYAPQQQADLDAFFQRGATKFSINIQGVIYEINLNTWNQINTANKTKTRKIKHDVPNGAGGNSTFQPSGPPQITRQALPLANTGTSLHHQVCKPPQLTLNIRAII
jgi:WWE domain